MNFSFKRYTIVALGVLALLDAGSAQMCAGDHDILSHNTEFNVTITCEPGTPDTYLGFDFANNAGPFADLYAGGWCIDVDRNIYCDENFSVDSYSSYDNPAIPPTAVDKPENLDLVNWLINTHPTESYVNISGCYEGLLGFEEYQEAIWTILDDKPATDLGAQDCVVDWLIQQAETYGDGYQLSCEDPHAKIGVILVIDDDSGFITSQVVMAEIPLAEIDGICDCGTGYVKGDPHFMTWSGELYDFHGICDLTFLQNPQFMNGLGMEIHVRSKKMMQQFSYISTAAIRIGSDMFEVAAHKDGDTYWLNGQQGPEDGVLGNVATIAGYPITFRQINSKQREYTIHISEKESIVFGTWKNFVRIDVKGATASNFGGSLGLMGSFDQKGLKLGRDGVTVFDDVNKFGMEWQVLSSEAALFHKADGPQHPQMCELPTKTAIRRRLEQSATTLAEAQLACSHVTGKEFDLCSYDVMVTNDKDIANAY